MGRTPVLVSRGRSVDWTKTWCVNQKLYFTHGLECGLSSISALRFALLYALEVFATSSRRILHPCLLYCDRAM